MASAESAGTEALHASCKLLRNATIRRAVAPWRTIPHRSPKEHRMYIVRLLILPNHIAKVPQVRPTVEPMSQHPLWDSVRAATLLCTTPLAGRAMYISLQLHKELSNGVGASEMHSKFSDSQGSGLPHGTEHFQDLMCATPRQMPSFTHKDITNPIRVRPDPNDKYGSDANAISPYFDVRAIAATAFALPDHHTESWPPLELRRRHLRRHHSAPAIISSAKKAARSSLSKEIGSACNGSQRREKKRSVRQWSKLVSRATRLNKSAKDKGSPTQGRSNGTIPFCRSEDCTYRRETDAERSASGADSQFGCRSNLESWKFQR